MFKYLICKPLVLADDSHEISYLIYFFLNLGLMSQNVSSVAVVIGALTVNPFLFSKQFEPDKAQHNFGSDLHKSVGYPVDEFERTLF